MKHANKAITLALSVVFTLCVPFAGCKKMDESATTYVTLTDFENVTETVGLGETYALPAGVAFDGDGNDYRVIYEVKNSKGEKVSVSDGKFRIKELGEGKYIITCYAQIESEKYLTRTITLNVVDRAAPVINASKMPFAYVGEEYTIGGVKITDNSGETIKPAYKVYNEKGEEIPVTGEKFTPVSKGEYTLKITAADSSGNSDEKQAPIYVREPMGKYVLENFNDVYGLSVFSVKEALLTDEDVKYHKTFDPTPEDPDNGDTRTGVAEGKSTLSTSATYGAHYYFKFDESFKDIGAFEYIYIKAYIKSSIAKDKPQVVLYSKNEPLGDGSGTKYNVNEWVEIRLSKDDICAPDSTFADPNEMRDGETPLDCFFRKMTTGSGYYLFYIPNHYYTVNGESVKDNAENYVLFVDEIGYQPMFNPTAELESQYDLGEYVTVAPKVITDEDIGDYEIEVTVTSPSGANVPLTDRRFRLTEAGDYTIELRYVSESYYGYTKYTVSAVSTKDIAIDAFDGSPVQGDTIDLPSATIDGGTVSVSVSIDGQAVEKETATSFKARCAGTYTATYYSEIDGLIYKKTLSIPVARGAVRADEVISFASAREMAENTAVAGFETKWLYSFAGEYGVVKLTSNGNGDDWSYFAFKNLQDMSAYADFKYMIARIYIPDSVSGLSGSISFGNDAASVPMPAERNEWINIAIPYAAFNSAWSVDDFNAYRKNIALDVIGDVYFSGAYMVKELPADDTPEPDVIPANAVSVLAVNGSGDLANILKTQDVASVNYLKTYEGANGVAKITSSGRWVRFNIQPVQEVSAYANYKYLVVRMYIEAKTTPKLTLEPQSGAIESITPVKTGEWVDYYFDGATFYNQLGIGWSNYYSSICANQEGTYYIDQVYMTNSEPQK